MFRYYFYLLLLVTNPMHGRSLDAKALHLTKDFAYAPIQSLEVLEDTSSTLALEDAIISERWAPIAGSETNFGFSDSAFWLRFNLHRDINTAEEWVLEFNYALHDKLTLFSPTSDGNYTRVDTGDLFKFERRPVSHRNFIFKLKPKENTIQTYYVRVKSSSSLKLGMTIWEPNRFIEHVDHEASILFLYYGTMLAMFFYNFLLYFTVKDRSYLYYLIYLLGHTLFQMSMNGLFFQYVAPNWPLMSSRNVPFLASITAIGLALFSMGFLETMTRDTRLHLILKSIIFSAIGLLTLNFAIPYALSIKICSVLTIFWAFLFVYVGFASYKSKYEPARLFLIAFSAFFIGVFLSAGATLNILPATFITLNGAQIGSMVEVILLSIALGSKINIERKQKYLAQSEALQHLKEKEHSYDQMAKVFYPHQLEGIRRGLHLEDTMPVHQSQAAVICFDIIRSTKIQHKDVKDFFSRIFIKCQEKMMEGYDSSTLSANGYRIKEMGDGFLCSVGYPFKSTESNNFVSSALALGESFLDIMKEEIKNFEYTSPINCSIAIALGDIEGFYPAGGTKEYTLFGKSIVLAKRYEEARRHLIQVIPTIRDKSIMIISRAIFEKLPPHRKEQFTSYALAEDIFTIRDDQTEKALYYKAVD